MPFLQGQQIQIGFGKETTANTRAGSILGWLPTLTPVSIQKSIEKKPLEDAVGTRAMSAGEQIIREMFEGEIESYVRPRLLPLFLRSLLGELVSADNSGVVTHTATVQANDIESPTFTTFLSKEEFGSMDFFYTGCVASSFELNTALEDIPKMTVGLMGVQEHEETTRFAPAYTMDESDEEFKQTDIQFKIATNKSGLSSATALKLNNSTFTITNNAAGRPTLSNKNYKAILAGLVSATANVEVDLEGYTYKSYFEDNNTVAVSIKLTSGDNEISSGNPYSFEIIYPTATITNRVENRGASGDVVTETLEITAHKNKTSSEELVELITTNNLPNPNASQVY